MARFDQGGGKRFGGNTGGGRSGGKSFGRPSFGARRSFGDRGERGAVEMHDAICSECQNECKVPFRPTGEKPVYCSECFSGKEGRGESGRPQRRDSGSRSSFGGNRGGGDNIKRQIEGMNAKLDRLAEAVESLIVSLNK